MLRAAVCCSQLGRWVRGLPVALCVHLIIAFISACGLSCGYSLRAAFLELLVVVLNSDMLKIVPSVSSACLWEVWHWPWLGWEGKGLGCACLGFEVDCGQTLGQGTTWGHLHHVWVGVSLVCQCVTWDPRVIKSAMQDKAPDWQEKLPPPQLQPCSTPLCCPSSARALNDIGMLVKVVFCCDSLLHSRKVKAMNLLIYFWVNISLVWMAPPFKPFVGEMNFGPEGKKCVTLGMQWGGKGQGFYIRAFSIPFFQEGILQLTESSMHVSVLLLWCFMQCGLGNVNIASHYVHPQCWRQLCNTHKSLRGEKGSCVYLHTLAYCPVYLTCDLSAAQSLSLLFPDCFFPYLIFPVLTVALYSENKNSSPTELSNLIPFLLLLFWETLLDFFKTENVYSPRLFRQAYFVCRNLVNWYVSVCKYIILWSLCVENNLSELEEDCPICFKMSHFLSNASH